MNHMLTREEMNFYLQTRSTQGYTVILASAFRGHNSEYPKANAYGETPFINDDITRPNIHSGYDYGDHIDYMVDTANSHDLIMALTVFAVGNDGGGYRYLNSGNAYTYGGGWARDMHPKQIFSGFSAGTIPWKRKPRKISGMRLAEELKDGSGNILATLQTYPSSSVWFHNSGWLDFNMIEPSASPDEIHPQITSDRNLSPTKPGGIGETCYEGDSFTVGQTGCRGSRCEGKHTGRTWQAATI